MKKKIIYIFLILTIVISSILYFGSSLIGVTEGYQQKIKYLIPQSIRDTLRKTIFANKFLKIDNEKLKKQLKKQFENEFIKASQLMPLINVALIKSESGKNSYIFSKYRYPYSAHFEWGAKPPGYIAQFGKLIFTISGSGEFLYFDHSELGEKNIRFKKLNSNFVNFIDLESYVANGITGPRDLEVIDNDIYVSFVDKNSCNKVSILRAKINFDYLNFENFFSWDACNSGKSYLDQRSGGRIKNYDKDNIIFTIGDYSKFYYPPEAQNPNSLFGKIIKINKNTSEYIILSMGHRNQQGLYVDKVKKLIFSTDHGPNGGDEVNFQNMNSGKIVNFGWPISSYGQHYSSRFKEDQKNKIDLLLRGAPLHKSHQKFGFIEPLKYYTPSIGISEIIKIPKSFNMDFFNDFFVTAMGNVVAEGDETIHHLRFDSDYKKIIFEDTIILRERIRDIIYDEEKKSFIMILGSTPSIGILKTKD